MLYCILSFEKKMFKTTENEATKFKLNVLSMCISMCMYFLNTELQLSKLMFTTAVDYNIIHIHMTQTTHVAVLYELSMFVIKVGLQCSREFYDFLWPLTAFYAACTTKKAVSYTHLDVYKRQI